MKIIKLLILCLLFSKLAFSGNMTMQYGGDWTKTTVVSNEDFFSISGAFVGTNIMKLESGEEIVTNDVCTGIFTMGVGGNGACKMKEANSEDFWVLTWICDGSITPTKCKGEAINGTGRFKGVSGKMTWIDKSGFGVGKGTFNLKQ